MEVHCLQDRGEAPVGSKRVEPWIDVEELQPRVSDVPGTLEITKSLFLVAKLSVD